LKISDPRVKADDNRDIHQRMREGWEYWAPHLHVWHGPGNHLTVLKQPHIQRLARWWRDGLTEMSNQRDPESL
jgi:arthrofactin-type cyclic lipopeptide synthetase C